MSSSFIIQKGPGIASKAYNYAKKLITGGEIWYLSTILFSYSMSSNAIYEYPLKSWP